MQMRETADGVEFIPETSDENLHLQWIAKLVRDSRHIDCTTNQQSPPEVGP